MVSLFEFTHVIDKIGGPLSLDDLRPSGFIFGTNGSLCWWSIFVGFPSWLLYLLVGSTGGIYWWSMLVCYSGGLY